MGKWMKKTCGLLAALLLANMSCLPVQATNSRTAETYDPQREGIISSYYEIDREHGFIRGIAPGTTSQHLLTVCQPESISLSQEKLVTGTKLTASESNLTAIVTGDLNGDGVASITDMLMVKAHLLGKELSAQEMAAGDVNYDGGVSITDFLRLKSNILGIEEITAGWRKGKSPSDRILLLSLGSSGHWSLDPVSAYASANEAVAVVAADGTITPIKKGSTYIYGLNEQGAVVARLAVSVVSDPLTVTVKSSSNRMTPGKSMTLNARINHPVTPKITWSSSDSGVATVDTNGTVEAHKKGNVVITATLPNGSTAQTQITVASPITAVKTDRTLYKVKPGATRQLTLKLTPAGEDEVFTWSSSDPSVATVNNQGIVTGVKNGTVTITAKGEYSGLSASCSVKVCNVKQVAITFDDGPGAYTKELLDFLREQDIKVSFFLLGSLIERYPGTVRQMAADGHEIGYHSYNHETQTSLSDKDIVKYYEESAAILKSVCDQNFTLWRTPGGAYNAQVLSNVPLPHIMWSVDTEDWKSRDPEAVYKEIMRSTKDGSIVLMHDIHSTTITGAIKALKEMQAGDFEFLTVTELLSRKGTPPEAGKNYFNG